MNAELRDELLARLDSALLTLTGGNDPEYSGSVKDAVSELIAAFRHMLMAVQVDQ